LRGEKAMKEKLILMVTILALLLAMTVGYVAPEIANRIANPDPVTMEVEDGMHGLLAPVTGGGSNAG
jgi:hypothetical protein